jgi:hypothetical protein
LAINCKSIKALFLYNNDTGVVEPEKMLQKLFWNEFNVFTLHRGGWLREGLVAIKEVGGKERDGWLGG